MWVMCICVCICTYTERIFYPMLNAQYFFHLLFIWKQYFIQLLSESKYSFHCSSQNKSLASFNVTFYWKILEKETPDIPDKAHITVPLFVTFNTLGIIFVSSDGWISIYKQLWCVSFSVPLKLIWANSSWLVLLKLFFFFNRFNRIPVSFFQINDNNGL